MSTREFEFRDGKSDKFWNITLDGKAYTVNFGRHGTTGQAQTKKWASEAEARRNHDKLIAEKTKKGYVETKAKAAKTAKANGAAKTPHPSPLPASRGEGTGGARGEGTASTSTERRIDLGPGEWAFATWRKPTPPKPPSPAPFDRDACDAKVRGLKFGGRDGNRPEWESIGLPEVMSQEEAHYWFLLMTARNQKERDARAKAKVDGRVTLADAKAGFKAVDDFGYSKTPPAALVLSHFLSPRELAEWLLDGWPSYWEENNYLDSYRGWVAPNLPEEDVEKFRVKIRKEITVAKFPADSYGRSRSFELAAALGMHDELRLVVESWEDDRYAKNHPTDFYQSPIKIIFGLGDPALVAKHVRRLRLSLRTPAHIAGWLAHTEWRALDVVSDSILKSLNKKECAELIAVFQRAVKAPEAAGPMLALSLKAKTPKGAREWLDANVGHAAVGLTAVAAGKGPLASAAASELRDLKRKGLGPQIADAVKALPPDQQKRAQTDVVGRPEVALPSFDAKTTPAWLAKGVAAAAKKEAPTWIASGDLPPLAVDGRQLSDEQVNALLAALKASTLDAPHPLVADLREHADPASADEFAWRLFERWLGAGASSKEKWAMAALGALDGDASVLKLTPMVREWPGESQHVRAVLGLEIMRAIGSDTALMQLNGIAQKMKFQALKAKAREFMDDIAKDKGMSRGELEDRMVPDFDLDERGRRVFDFGARRFNFVLGPDLRPMLRDDDDKAKLRDNLPEPGAKDDAAKAEAAIAEWSAIKKQVRDAARAQAVRLEQAMVTGRRWKAADFQTLVLRHPLMTHLARVLLWGVYDGKRLRATFRVTEEQECMNVDDQPYALSADRAIGVVHPLQLDDGAREAWGQRFGDYAIAPPFPQLGRAIHRLEKGEDKKTSLDRFDKLKVPAPSLVFTLEKQGWSRGLPGDAGVFDEHSRQFPAARITALVTYEGNVGMGYVNPEEQLKITGCTFIDGLREPGDYRAREKTLKVGEVDPIVLSETLHDLTIVASKARS
ncbi:MAG TPA: DUF4132 domain-containing protein [Polyangia bacterium]|nr:DUF4132 domain-containing protein [Polyangia bacterium]